MIRCRLLSLLSAICICLFCAASELHAQVTQSDFNGDGLSEYVLIEIESDKTLSWSAVNPADSSVTSLNQLGASGDHIILAPWKGTSKPQIGVVTHEDGSIVWKIMNDEGTVEERSLGKKGYTAISGGDYDGNGIADAAVAKLKRKKVQWSVAYDLFNSPVGQANIADLTFGVSGDRIFFASPDGVSDWLGVAGKGATKDTLIRLKSLTTGEVRTFSRFPRFISKPPRPRPFPIKQASGIDVLGFAKTNKSNTKLYVRSLEGATISDTILPGKGDMIVGDFTSSPGEEVAIKTSSGFTVYNPFSATTSQITTASGIPVDEINLNTVQGGTSSTPSNPDDGGNSGPVDNVACRSVSPFPGTFIYKTIGSNHFTDVRRNTAGLILEPGARGPFPGCINVVDKDGNVVAKMGLYATGNGWAARYYAGIGCGSGTPYNGSTIASRARQKTGSSSILFNFGNTCYGPIDATRCIGSSQC